MRPQNGWYLVHANDGQGHVTTVTYEVRDEGIPTTFGLLAWNQAGDRFQRGSIALRCNGSGTGVAVNGPDEYEVTCEKIA